MTSVPNGESKEPVIRLFVPPLQWYENAAGRRFVPTAEESRPPDDFDVMHSLDAHVEHVAYKYEDGDTSVIGAVTSNWDDRLVFAMATSTPYVTRAEESALGFPPDVRGKFTLRQAILIAATACERCVNALSWYFGVTDGVDRVGYPAGGDEFNECTTRCHFCATDEQLNAIADATMPGERFFVDTPRHAPELFTDTPAPIAKTRHSIVVDHGDGVSYLHIPPQEKP